MFPPNMNFQDSATARTAATTDYTQPGQTWATRSSFLRSKPLGDGSVGERLSENNIHMPSLWFINRKKCGSDCSSFRTRLGEGLVRDDTKPDGTQGSKQLCQGPYFNAPYKGGAIRLKFFIHRQ